MKSEHNSMISIHVAVFFFGLAGLFGKLVALPATLIVLGRVVFACLVLAVVLVAQHRSLKLHTQRDGGYMVVMGLVLAIHWITFFQAIQVSTVAIGLLTFSTFPVFVTFMEPFFFKERLRRSDVTVALAAAAGVALVIPRFEFANQIVQGALWGIASGFTFAVLSILNRRFARHYSSLVIAFYQDLVAAVVLLPLLFVYDVRWELKQIMLLAFLGVVCTGLAHSLFIRGMALIKARTASVVACLEPVYGIMVAAFLLNEIPDTRVITGGVVILCAAAYASIKGVRTPAGNPAK
ncbi:MAG: DMT family transporter [Desulfobacteraceae bacterium]|jgi:drug/metabolite transporter (DMT)-like permease